MPKFQVKSVVVFSIPFVVTFDSFVQIQIFIAKDTISRTYIRPGSMVYLFLLCLFYVVVFIPIIDFAAIIHCVNIHQANRKHK